MSLPFPASLTILVPAYNEAENLPHVLAELAAAVPKVCADAEILIVDDGSADATPQLLERFCAEADASPGPGRLRRRCIRHPKNRGLTAALRTGFAGAEGEYLTWTPADGQIPFSELTKILAAWRGEDLVLSTYRQRPDGLVRRVMSKTTRLLMWAAIGLVDRIEGPYLFRTALFKELGLISDAAAGSIGLELAAKARARGYRIGTTEIECVPRLSGRSKVANLKNILSTLNEIRRIRRSMRETGRG